MSGDSNNERFDGKTHVPDEASNSTGSGTVCWHCGAIESEHFGATRHCIKRYGKNTRILDSVFHAEPAPAEQPRQERIHKHTRGGNDFISCDDCGQEWDYRKPGTEQPTCAPVAASPAEGPRQPNPNCPVCKGEGGYGIWRCACTAPRRSAQPSPDAAKVEEITRELIKRLNLEDEEEAQIAAILRPYFLADATAEVRELRANAEQFGHDLANIFAIAVSGVCDAAVVKQGVYGMGHVIDAVTKCADAAKKTRSVSAQVKTALEALRWSVDYIADGVDYMHGGTPQHDCGFTSDPESGHCEFHRKFFESVAALSGTAQSSQSLETRLEIIPETKPQ